MNILPIDWEPQIIRCSEVFKNQEFRWEDSDGTIILAYEERDGDVFGDLISPLGLAFPFKLTNGRIFWNVEIDISVDEIMMFHVVRCQMSFSGDQLEIRPMGVFRDRYNDVLVLSDSHAVKTEYQTIVGQLCYAVAMYL